MSNLRVKTTKGLKWSAIERLSTQFVQIGVVLLLAKMLGPEAFGLIGMLSVFIAIGQVLADSGLGAALIRKRNCTEIDFSTAFFFNIFVSVFCYIVLFFSAPYISSFYEQPELINLIKVLGGAIVINAFCIVQRTKLTIEMNFKTQAKASFLSVIFSSSITLILTYLGYGVWALVAQVLLTALCNVIFLNWLHPWCPKVVFSKKSFNYLFGFGSKLLVSSLIDTIYKNIYQIIIGKTFNVNQVGIFTQANQLSSMPATTITTVIQRVTYPMLSKIQDENEKLENAYLLTLRIAAAVVFPIMLGLAVVSKPLLFLLLGEVWVPAAHLVSILCLGYLLYPIHAINLNLLKVKGRSDLFLKLEIIKKISITFILFFTVPMGIEAICYGMIIQSYFALIINTFYTGKLTNLSTISQFQSLLPIWLISFFSALVSWFAGNILSNNTYQILAIFVVMPVVYVLLIKILQKDVFILIRNTIFNKKLSEKEV